MNYKDTLNLPRTDFSMKANLIQKEPSILEMWDKADVYASLRKKRAGDKKFVLHDGPPYANGNIHMGHVLNKILKDIVVRFHSMKGLNSPFVPGWDCHGLPVEHQLFKELGISQHEIDQVEFRKKARKYALDFVKVQKKEFKRLGIYGDWEHPYLTLDPHYEAAIIRSFADMVRKGYIYRDLKPVNWCTRCETALAEAEVEYEDHASPSIYVKFRVDNFKNVPQTLHRTPNAAYFIIWTTTPWTLLGNVAIAIHPEMDYVFLQVDDEEWIMLESIAEATMGKLNRAYKLVNRVKGSVLEGILCVHPFLERHSSVVLANYVSSEEGTGCVHTAPGHGQEDYVTGKKYGLPMIMPVDPKGNFDKTCGEFSGINVHKANRNIIRKLESVKSLLAAEEVRHSYPHCWRCKEPIIFRATEQYFARIDHNNLRQSMLKTIDKEVKWYPEAGRQRIYRMIENRPDWCLSRQRYWGVPIVAFKCAKCGELLLDATVIEHVAIIVSREGSDAWFAKKEEELLPEGTKCLKCGDRDLRKERDIIDVWFESGVSHQSVLKNKKDLEFPCQLYLEGSDQHRGWFQSALITSYAIEGRAPYESVLTHGFVVDGEGKKMSKSQGNVISPQDVMKKYGADILRLWVASSNYHDDVRLSEEILSRLADAYRKIRNTFRYLLGSTCDFDPKHHRVKADKMLEIDRWMLSRLAAVIEECEKNYSDYMFYRIYRTVYNFCVYEISSLYLDILKDRLYTFEKDSIERRSAQTVLNDTFEALLALLAPIIPFTIEEASMARNPKSGSIHETKWHWDEKKLRSWRDKALDEKWSKLIAVREEVLKALEVKRASGEIGSSLEAKVMLHTKDPQMKQILEENKETLAMLFITSQAILSEKEQGDSERAAGLPLEIWVGKADGEKCNRCWNYSKTVGKERKFSDICSRCVSVVEKMKS